MTLFHFKVKTAAGALEEGEREAEDKFALSRSLQSDGSLVISIKELGKHKSLASLMNFSIGGEKISMHERIIFARNLGSMVLAGLTVIRSLSVMQRQSRNKTLRSIITKLSDDVARGLPLSEAMKNYPKVFSPLFISMTKAGEESGTLAKTLNLIADQLEKTYTLGKKVKGALIYPGVIITIMIVVGVIMMIYIVPTLTATFSGLNVTLPWSTLLIISVSNFLRTQLLLTVAVVVIVIFLFSAALRTKIGGRIFDFFTLHIPVIGTLIKETNTARTALTLSSLLSAGITLPEATRATSEVLQNVFYKDILDRSGKSILRGEPMSDVFGKATHLYPLFMSEMISVGEETGKLPEMLMQVARFYETEVDQKTKDLSTVIEPLLMVFVAAAVGFFAISMISPIYSLVNTI